MQNLTLLTDFYQLTMMQGYFQSKKDQNVVFDMFFRKAPCGGGYAIVAGIMEVVWYIQNLKFSKDDILYLKNLKVFEDDFLHYLEHFKFTGEIYAVEEGSIIFAHEPILRVKANILQAQFIETAILNIINFQTLIATKSSRVIQSAKNDIVMEFGLRRAQSYSAGIYGSKACVIGGCAGTSNVLAAKKYNLVPLGTHSHSWIQSFETELEAFETYAKVYPNNALLLVDTYDTLNSGVPNAIKVFKKLKKQGYKPAGIRIDSGDLDYLSKKARQMLDNEGLQEVKISASSNLDEYQIEHLKSIGAKIDIWGVGTKLITSHDNPSLGGVYKLSAILKDNEIIPKIKISNDPRKINNPGLKQVHRIYDKNTNKAIADLITLHDENLKEDKELDIFHPLYTYKSKKITNFYTKKLLSALFIDGKLVRKIKTVQEIAQYTKQEKQSMWPEYLRNIKPETYKVDLSLKLWQIRKDLIQKNKHYS